MGNSFSNVSNFPTLCKACYLYYFSAALKRLAFSSSAIMFYVMKAKSIKLWKVLHPTPEHNPEQITHLFTKRMTSQAYNNNDVLLFPLQIWKQPHRDADCFEHLHEKNAKLFVNVSVSHARPQISLWFSQKGGEEWKNSNRMGQRCWCSCDCVSSPSFW